MSARFVHDFICESQSEQASKREVRNRCCQHSFVSASIWYQPRVVSLGPLCQLATCQLNIQVRSDAELSSMSRT